ncbi:MAG: hypothetical protein R2762_20600 [Bryobacteraceae bacterium]
MARYAALLAGLVCGIFMPALDGQSYAGSAACKSCHPDTYQRWSKTRMANVVLDQTTSRSDPT